ncbi:hypothetical protein C8R47DRAFT_130894 [Mycena vitilis]|nr:hypothetical protein C8R47DRAFT_130894 [Mycena vitilis]
MLSLNSRRFGKVTIARWRHLKYLLDANPLAGLYAQAGTEPVRRDLHMGSNEGTPTLTLFPHEDVLAKALEYELALAALRQAEVDTGRADPGRPSHETAYGSPAAPTCPPTSITHADCVVSSRPGALQCITILPNAQVLVFPIRPSL